MSEVAIQADVSEKRLYQNDAKIYLMILQGSFFDKRKLVFYKR